MRPGDTDENMSPLRISALITSQICLDKLELRIMFLIKLYDFVDSVFMQCPFFNNINSNLICPESSVIAWPKLSTPWKIMVEANDGSLAFHLIQESQSLCILDSGILNRTYRLSRKSSNGFQILNTTLENSILKQVKNY